MFLSGDLSNVCITTPRLTLRAFRESDAAESFAAITPNVTRYMSWNVPESQEAHRAVCAAMAADAKAGRQLSLVVRETDGGAFVGVAGLHPNEGDLLETGLWLAERAWGRGFGREMISAVVGWASSVFRPSGFIYPVVDENVASRRFAEALGGEVIGSRQRQKPGDVERTLVVYRIPAPK
jgi:RimJ/RimL family protein N-acetyltransferase